MVGPQIEEEQEGLERLTFEIDSLNVSAHTFLYIGEDRVIEKMDRQRPSVERLQPSPCRAEPSRAAIHAGTRGPPTKEHPLTQKKTQAST